MSADALITLIILATFLLLVLSGRLAVDFTLAAAMTALMVTGVLSPAEALDGFSNPALFVIAAFYVVSSAIKESGALHWWVSRWLGHSERTGQAVMRVMFPVAAISSLISNTPVVAIFIPQIQDWARRHKVSVSKLLIPLSYASILGGTCTLIGTSTNILIVGLLQKTTYVDDLHIFSPIVVGAPLVLVGLLYFTLVGYRLLPDRKSAGEVLKDAREYAVTMRVDHSGPLVGKTITNAGLRHLRHSFLSEIQTEGRVLPAVGPEEILHGDDVLVFVGQPEAVGELRQFRGLIPAEGQVMKLDVPFGARALIEAVIAPASNLVGKSIRKSNFRTQFAGAILAVSRNGERINQKVGNIELKGGDTLLLEASRGFVRRHRYSRDFLLLSRLDDVSIPDHRKAPRALGLLGLFLVAVLSGGLPLVAASFLLVAGLLLARCISIESAQKSIDTRLLLAIGSSLALGFALQKTGLANQGAQAIMALANGNPHLNLLLLYLVTVLVTELITNNAAAVLMFPIAQALSTELDLSLLPFVMTIMFAASASFMTPFGYQTNLMVQGPGGYHAVDYLRSGSILSILTALVVICLVPVFWPL